MKKMIEFQSIIINTDERIPNSLYYRGNVSRRNGSILLKAGQFVGLDTYFNMISIWGWRKYTLIDKVEFQVKLSGTGKVELWGINAGEDERLLYSQVFDCDTASIVEVGSTWSLEKLPEYCFLKIFAEERDVVVFGGGVQTSALPVGKPRIACCFCTYKREKELQQNVRELIEGIVNNPDSPLHESMEIYIADNGHTLSEGDFENRDIVHLFQNRNYGGSSGFTRCMIESILNRPGTFTHVILMDDDAWIKPYVVDRTASILRFIRPDYEECSIGGALLSLTQPWLQLENRANFYNQGIRVAGAHVDLNDRRQLIDNCQDKTNYNGWFYSCIPASIITKTNLPLPVFLHGDDIDYGLRCKAGFIRMNGLCVWHPNPGLSRRPHIAYYDGRNFAIVGTTHAEEPSRKRFIKQCFKSAIGRCLLYRYEDALYRARGYEDFLKGIDWLKAQEPESLNRELMQWKAYPKCRIEHIESMRLDMPIIKQDAESKRRQKLNWLLPAIQKKRVYGSETEWMQIDFYRAREVCIVDPQTGDGIALRKSYRMLFKVFARYVRLALLARKTYPRVSQEWRDRIHEIQSEGFWRSFLDIE